MRVLVCGGRDFEPEYRLVAALSVLHGQYNFSVLIEGDARGADRMAGAWADDNGVQKETYQADWKRFGRGAGYVRNRQMLDEGRPELVIAFPGGRGTRMMIELAKEAGINVIELPA